MGLVHGRMKPSEKDEVMNAFHRGEFHCSFLQQLSKWGLMFQMRPLCVLKGSERFGLSQLHQLRGRVGHGLISLCILVSDSKNDVELKSA
ncbi:MAG: hypothetical protein ACLUPK_08275 [Veillonella sp.]